MRATAIHSLFVFLAVLLFALGAAPAALAQDTPSPAVAPELVEFVETTSVEISIPQADESATTNVTLRNLTSSDQVVAFCFLNQAPNSTCATSPVTIVPGEGDGTIAASTVVTIPLTVTQTGRQQDVSGLLLVTVEDQAQDVRPATISHESFSIAAVHILAASFLIAAAFTFARKASLHGARKRPLVDNPSFKGWATAVTVVAGIGAPVLKELLGGESTLLPGGEFAILGILFALLIFIAPLIYGLDTKPADSNTLVAGESTTTPPIMGTWSLFWLSIALSVWAFSGTAIAVGAYIVDAWDSGALSFANTVILGGACFAVLVLLGFHSWRQIDHITSEEPLSTTQLMLSGVTDIQTMRVIVQPQVRRRFSGL